LVRSSKFFVLFILNLRACAAIRPLQARCVDTADRFIHAQVMAVRNGLALDRARRCCKKDGRRNRNACAASREALRKFIVGLRANS